MTFLDFPKRYNLTIIQMIINYKLIDIMYLQLCINTLVYTP